MGKERMYFFTGQIKVLFDAHSAVANDPLLNKR